jgi:hypothetical protein
MRIYDEKKQYRVTKKWKNVVILHKEIFEKKNYKVGKNKFYNEQKKVKKSSR